MIQILNSSIDVFRKNRKINEILGLNFDGVLVESVVPLRREVRSHFENYFTGRDGDRPWLGRLSCSVLNENDSNMLSARFTEENIRSAI